MPALAYNLTGKQFGRLTVLHRIGSKHNKALWLCGCLCGKQTKVISVHLVSGNTTSCNACQDAVNYPKEYYAWRDMIARCSNKEHKYYSYYGERGITVCKEWRVEFFNFLLHVGLAPDVDLSLGRIDNNLGYQPGNVRWITWSNQMKNRRFHNQFDH